MRNTFAGKETDFLPVAPHWWGDYKFELADKSVADAARRGETRSYATLAEVDMLLFETFAPDWFHLGAGCPKPGWDDPKARQRKALLPELRRLESPAAVDEFVELSTYTKDEIHESGVYEHVKTISARYGDSAFIALNEGNPVCEVLDPHGIIGFEEGLIALAEKPALMERLIFGLYDARLHCMEALADNGGHAYVGSETFISADLISPSMFRSVIFPALKHFYHETRKRGLEPISYFLGDVIPLIGDINEFDITVLLVEESKKNFQLDVVDIRKRLRENITLFGNLDSIYCMLRGTPEDVTQETRRQMRAAEYGRFVMANGSPLTPSTPVENLHAMVRTARERPYEEVARGSAK